MSKVIRLTESDLVNIVKKVISEQTKNSDDFITNLKKSVNRAPVMPQSVCPIGFKQMTQQEISSYDKSLVKPWASTTDGSGDYQTSQGGKIICKRNSPRRGLNSFEGLTIHDVANGFRDAISGVAGSVAQIIIAAMGGQAINTVAWGLLVAYDIYYWVEKGAPDWFNIINDLIWLLLTGVGGKIFGALKPLLKGESKLLNIFIKASKTSSWNYLKSFLSKITSYETKVISLIKQSITTITSKVPMLKTLLTPLLRMINRVGGLLKMIQQTFVEFSKINPVMKVAKVVKPVVKPVVKGAKEYVKGDIQSRAVSAGLNAGFGRT